MKNLTLGDMITMFYDEYLALYGDEEIASVATAVSVNEMLLQREDDVELIPFDEEASYASA